MSNLFSINQANLHDTLNLQHFINHDAANDHGPAVTVLSTVSLFETNGLGEGLHTAVVDLLDFNHG